MDGGGVIELDLSPASLREANVNPATGLATDFLNLFNEALMLISLVGEAPELLDELADWKPASYEDHFRNSGFQHRDVVIAAYRAADPVLRGDFDAAARELCGLVDAAVTRLSALQDTKQPIADAAQELLIQLQDEIARLGAMINGGGVSASQDAIDALFD
jgi:hypothetical protein